MNTLSHNWHKPKPTRRWCTP